MLLAVVELTRFSCRRFAGITLKVVSMDKNMNSNISHSLSNDSLVEENQIPPRSVADIPSTFTEPEAARWLKISRVTLQRIRLRGDIGFCRIGGTRVLYTSKHLEDYLTATERKALRNN